MAGTSAPDTRRLVSRLRRTAGIFKNTLLPAPFSLDNYAKVFDGYTKWQGFRRVLLPEPSSSANATSTSSCRRDGHRVGAAAGWQCSVQRRAALGGRLAAAEQCGLGSEGLRVHAVGRPRGRPVRRSSSSNRATINRWPFPIFAVHPG